MIVATLCSVDLRATTAAKKALESELGHLQHLLLGRQNEESLQKRASIQAALNADGDEAGKSQDANDFNFDFGSFDVIDSYPLSDSYASDRRFGVPRSWTA